MRIGFHLTPFWSPATRRATDLIDEAVRLAAAASRVGFGHPSFFPHPLPILARLAPEAGAMRLKGTKVRGRPVVPAARAVPA